MCNIYIVFKCYIAQLIAYFLFFGGGGEEKNNGLYNYTWIGCHTTAVTFTDNG